MFALTQTLPKVAVVPSLLDFDKIPASLTVQKHTGFLVGKITKTELMIKLLHLVKNPYFAANHHILLILPFLLEVTFLIVNLNSDFKMG
jgi:hypothetical protein